MFTDMSKKSSPESYFAYVYIYSSDDACTCAAYKKLFFM